MTNGSGMVRRSLGRRLKALRLGCGKSIDDVRIVGSRDKIWRIESGKGPYKFPDVQSLCLMYGASQDTINQLTDLALKTTTESIYEDLSDVVPTWFATYIELESAASTISMYEPDLVPGLLQTPEYSRAVFEAFRPAIAPDAIERFITSRRQRQEIVFARSPQVCVKAVLSEGVLARQVGGKDSAATQFTHLRTLCAANKLQLRVLTWDSGAHAAMEGGFSLLDFADPEEPTIAYQENRAGARYLEGPKQVRDYREMYDAITEQSVSLEEYAP